MMRGGILLSSLALVPFVAAEEKDCCDIDGHLSGHIFGVIMGLLLLVSLNGWMKIKKPNWYSPGTSAFCRRMLFNEVLDLLITLMIFFAPGYENEDDPNGDGVSTDEGDEEAFSAFGICNSLVLVFLVVYWSRPIQKMNIFTGSSEDRGKRGSLSKQLRNARTTITGRKLISERLRADVEGFNQRLKDKYNMARTMALQAGFFKIFDVVLLGYMYTNLCERTVCDFWKQVGTIMLLATFYVSSEDIYRLRNGKPELIHLAKEEGRGKANVGKATMSRMEAYNLVRDLIAEILDVGKFCAYYIATDNEFRTVSVQIYDWEQNPEKDPRIEACMWCSSYAMALANAMANDRHVSVTALHLANSSMKLIRDQLILTTPNRGVLLQNVAVLYQTSFHSLPDDDREWLDENIRVWATECQQLDDPKQYTVLFLGQILPEDVPDMANIEDALEALIAFYDQQHRDLLSGRPLLIIDDATLEWINIAWANLLGKLDSRPEINQLQAYIDTILIQQHPIALREAAILIDEFRRRMKDNTALPMDLLLGGLVSKFKDLVEKEESRLVDGQDDVAAPRRLHAKPNQIDAAAPPRNQAEWEALFIEQAGGQDQTLNRVQFRKIYTTFGLKPSPMELSKYFQDGVLDWDEFHEFLNNHNLGGWRDVVPETTSTTVVPSVSVDPIPVELIRVHGAKGTELLAPIPVGVVNDRLDEDLDIRSFAPEGASGLMVSIDSPLRAQHANTKAKNSREDPELIGKKGKTVSRNLKGKKAIRRVSLPSKHKVKEFVLDWTLYLICAAAYIWTFINSAQHIGDSNGDDMDEKTFLGLPPYYDFENEKHHRVFIPLLYADMHCALVTFALLPLTMSRWLIRLLSGYAWLGRLFRIEHAYWWHKRCGYNLAWLLLTGGILWWLALMYSCTENSNGPDDNLCFAFYPAQGEYFDFYDNGASVIFLRELVLAAMVGILVTSGLVFAQSMPFGRAGLQFKVFYAYEIFYYTHLAGAYTIAVLALTSRWDVFYPTVCAWGLYAFDVCMMMMFNTHPTKVHGATCFSSGSQAVLLKLKKPPRFKYRAGQTVFLKIPSLSWVEWHPFSIASAPDDEHVEFLIDCSHGANQWTDRLFKACEGRGTTYEMTSYSTASGPKGAPQGANNLTVVLYGPNGSAFQAFEASKGVMLVGGGSGLPSSLSGLRHMFNVKRNGGTLKAKVIAFVWSTRSIEQLLWCWDHLKLLIEREVGYEKKTKWTSEHEAALANLSQWLDISINVTQMNTQHLNRLVDIEKNSDVGSWLVHRLNSGRITAWADIFQRFHSSVNSRNIKVFFCGPGRMAKAIRVAAKDVAGFNVEVSSENFHDG